MNHPSSSRRQSGMLWGLAPRDLHDRLWAARGFHVVRRGDGRINARTRDPFLLLPPARLALIDLDPAQPILRRRANRWAPIRLPATQANAYGEHVEGDSAGRLVAIRRRYTTDGAEVIQAHLTADAEAASMWATAVDDSAAQRALRRAAGPRGPRECCCHGRLYEDQDPAEIARFLADARAEGWPINQLCPDAIELQPGVWAHRTSRLAAGARIIPPLWIGAGVTLERGSVTVGPAVVPDAMAIEAAPQATPSPTTRRARRRTAPAASPPRAASKRAFDIAFSMMALTLGAPLFPLIMLAIWLEDGRPFFFAHRRQTYRGREFVCYKFRTMCRNAERLKARLAEKNICDGPQFHIKDDPRLLRVGRVLRKFHLDELPQFYNVLLGQMHIVGPRPSPDNENQYCPAWREARLSVKPGMTGLWQVARTRAPNTDFQEWIRYDLEYVHRQSWAMDLWIVYRTIRTMLGHIPMPRLRRRRHDGHRAAMTIEPKPAPTADEKPLVVTRPPQVPDTAGDERPGEPVTDYRAAA